MDLIFNRNELIKFLELLDKELQCQASLYIIGGSAACIAFDSKHATKDIDTWKKEKAVDDAYDQVIKKNPRLKVPLAPALIQINSPKMQARFVKYKDTHFDKLNIYVPEAEDLFLMKAQRADEKDLFDLEELSKKVKLSPLLILDRFRKEILPLHAGSDELLIDRYLICIERVFGDREIELHERELSD